MEVEVEVEIEGRSKERWKWEVVNVVCCAGAERCGAEQSVA